VHTSLVFALFTYLALLGISAIDPIGIAAMPILLLQKQPVKRSFIFLGGSFVSLIGIGLLFAKGFGQTILNFEKFHSWFVPGVEVVAGLTLLSIVGTLLWRMKTGRLSIDPPASMVKRLQLGNWQLFIVGALLVAFQSTVDVVFVIAMIRVGQLRLSNITLTAAVVTYAVTALVLQLSVVVAYMLTSPKRRAQTLDKVHNLLVKYANQALIGVSFLLGCVLLVLATQR
jgi:hypothetical protein